VLPVEIRAKLGGLELGGPTDLLNSRKEKFHGAPLGDYYFQEVNPATNVSGDEAGWRDKRTTP
jgi:hypothetical protein